MLDLVISLLFISVIGLCILPFLIHAYDFVFKLVEIDHTLDLLLCHINESNSNFLSHKISKTIVNNTAINAYASDFITLSWVSFP